MTRFGHNGTGAAGPRTDDDVNLTVGRAAALVGVSVRTLHHWDEIGLVRPSGRTSADYRVYSGDDVARIHRVLLYREVGLTLAEVARLLDDPNVDEITHLRQQRELLTNRISHLHGMIRAVDHMMEVKQMGTNPSAQERAEIFGDDWKPEWDQEAQERWGDTPQWAQSQERAAALSAEERQQVKADGDAVNAALADAKRSGVVAGSGEANELVERHRAMIGQLYDCSHSMQVCLAKLYVDDSRFTAYYDNIEPGLTAWLYEAIVANARTHGVDPDTAAWE